MSQITNKRTAASPEDFYGPKGGRFDDSMTKAFFNVKWFRVEHPNADTVRSMHEDDPFHVSEIGSYWGDTTGSYYTLFDHDNGQSWRIYVYKATGQDDDGTPTVQMPVAVFFGHSRMSVHDMMLGDELDIFPRTNQMLEPHHVIEIFQTVDRFMNGGIIETDEVTP